jgi:hypothetical protein
MKVTILVAAILILQVIITPFAISRMTLNPITRSKSVLPGKILFAPVASTQTYMVDDAGNITNTWNSSYWPGFSVHMAYDGTMLRSIHLPNGYIGEGGGGIERYSMGGTLLWQFTYLNDTHCTHHDFAPMPNGNVLMISYEVKSKADCIQVGRINAVEGLFSEEIIEVKPTGPTSGNIVWRWSLWQHLVQDYDPTKPDYGNLSQHPELADINYGGDANDFVHANSIDYNLKFDQILLSVRNFNEVWVLDHSTTTEEASGHTGGKYSHGGDILYRWGNPESYDRGNASDRVFWMQHGVSWVHDGYPGAGHILVYNNGFGGRYFSTVDEFAPPVNETGFYSLEPGKAYGPSGLCWTYSPTPQIYNWHFSNANRLPDGNTLIASGDNGHFFIVTPAGNTIWNYQYWIPPPVGIIFNVCFIPNGTPPTQPKLATEGSFTWNHIKPGDTVQGDFQVKNIGSGTLYWAVNHSSIGFGNWTFSPTLGELTAGKQVDVHVTMIVPDESYHQWEGYIAIYNVGNTSDISFVPVFLKTDLILGKGISLMMHSNMNTLMVKMRLIMKPFHQ